jgi:TPP-dependent pyruvate/acetoin dehydrogenase alpha subunit
MRVGAGMTKDELIAFEAEVAAAFNAGKIRAPVHLSGGNEEQLIAFFEEHEIGQEDWVATTWRSHYHCLLKGVPRETLMVDILAGKSITLNYPEHRVISSAIVGGVLPIALGIAWAIKSRKKFGLDEYDSARVFVFVGDMTTRGGMFHECVQYANGKGLPIKFVVEDNGISVCTPTAETWGLENLGGKVHNYSYNLPWPHSGAGHRVQF